MDSAIPSPTNASYLIVESPDGVTVYTFTTNPRADVPDSVRDDEHAAAIRKTRSPNPRDRVRGLAELAGRDDPESLVIGLSMLSDPDESVREEATILVLEHEDGTSVAETLGLKDDELGD